MDPLFSSLLELLSELDRQGVPLTVGGGFGLYLKRAHLARTGERTLFVELPEVRSTNDIDMFLRAEVLADLSRAREVASAIERLGYTPVEGAEYLHLDVTSESEWDAVRGASSAPPRQRAGAGSC